MSIEQVLVYAFAALTVSAALGVLLFRNLLYAAFALLLTFLGVAGLYVLAGADLLAVVQIVIYVGGILVLLIFGIMLTQQRSEKGPISGAHNRILAVLVAGGLFTLFTIIIIQVNTQSISWIAAAEQSEKVVTQSTLSGIGVALMSEAVLPFEIAGVLLLVALIGAAYVAGKK